MTDQNGGADIGAVIFDFAGVLTVSPRTMMTERAAVAGRSFADLAPILMGPVDEDTDHPWHRIERGEITLDEFDSLIGPMMRDAGLDDGLRPPRPDEMLARLTPVEEMVEAARLVRAAGYATAILSNNVREWAAWRTLVDAEALVDVVVDSSEVGMRKPSVEIFELTAERLRVDTGRCLMLDDFEWNIRGAAEAGMQTMHITDPVAGSVELLDRVGVG